MVLLFLLFPFMLAAIIVAYCCSVLLSESIRCLVYGGLDQPEGSK
jgi:hypothetical protein